MLRLLSLAIIFATLTFLSCSDSATSESEGDSSSEQLEASSSLQSSTKKTSSGALSSGTSSTLAPSSPSSSEKASSVSNVYWNQSISYSVLTDARDKKNYRTTQIGTQNWMAENLNFTAKVGESRCYDAKTTNCTKYGRLYDWEAATASCPVGWHLPDSTEWNQLAKHLGGVTAAGKNLKASTTLWSTNTGNDAFGFAALPSGSYDNDQYYDLGTAGLWWTSSELNSTIAYYRDIIGTANALRAGQESKAISLAVRCVEDSETQGSSTEVTSSSSETVSLSSLAVSSSTVALVPPDRNCSYAPVTPATSPATGTLTCPNNEVYKTVTIGSAIWMAQNLNYGTIVSGTGATGNQSNDGVIEKYCYGDDPVNCDSDGGLYQWTEAMGFKFACSSVLLTDATCNETIAATNHQGICPTGWHIPNAAEWVALIGVLGGDSTLAGSKMKLKNTNYTNWDTTSLVINDGNSSGFSAFPAGNHNIGGGFGNRGLSAGFWEATAINVIDAAYIRDLSYSRASIVHSYCFKKHGFSIRCVKNP